MLELCRTVRFCLTAVAGEANSPRDNTFSAWPAMRGLGRYYELAVTCKGQADPQTGYFINIKHIDQAVRDRVLPHLRGLLADDRAAAQVPMGRLVHTMLGLLQEDLQHSVAETRLVLTPFTAITARRHDMDHARITQQYEFSAAHRLHVPGKSDDENRAIFGKCNNPAGHGHNYKVQVVVDAPIDPAGHTLDLATLDAAVDAHCIQKLDHKHLNLDVPEFADLNPSVEHIVQVVWAMLQAYIPGGATLAEVSVRETGKTVCTYRGATAGA